MTSQSLDMLKSEEGHLNAVFACFGSAAQHCQFFEAALADFLLAYNKVCHSSWTMADLDAVEIRLQKQTMGKLLAQFRKHVSVDDDAVASCMSEALTKRNFLMHSYFLERGDQFHSEQGRLGMLKELAAIGALLEKASALTGGMRVAMQEALSGRDSSSAAEALFSIQVDLPDRVT